MIAPAWLIAEREFRTYVSTLSFWIALAIGPIAAGGALLVTGGHASPQPIQIRTDNTEVARLATTAINEAGRLENRKYAIGRVGPSVDLVDAKQTAIVVRFDIRFPLSTEGRTLFVRTLERDAARRVAGHTPPVIRMMSQSDGASKPDGAAIGRITQMMLLWLTLTGSLGMLLQSVVRERANRALESLLAAASSWEIMIGKLLGTGAVSLVVLATLLGSLTAYAFLNHSDSGAIPAVTANLATPIVLVRAVLIYVLAYAFYGSVTVGLGALARDVPAAQNLSRPMFVMLLAAFFVALVSAGGGPDLSWLIYVPPFAPFVLLMHAPGDLPAISQIVSLGLMAAAAAIAAMVSTKQFLLPGARRNSGGFPGAVRQ